MDDSSAQLSFLCTRKNYYRHHDARLAECCVRSSDGTVRVGSFRFVRNDCQRFLLVGVHTEDYTDDICRDDTVIQSLRDLLISRGFDVNRFEPDTDDDSRFQLRIFVDSGFEQSVRRLIDSEKHDVEIRH